jgi:TolB-like protein
MILSTNFSTRTILLLCAALFTLAACAAKSEPPSSQQPAELTLAPPAVGKGLKIAVLPAVNFSGASAPLDAIQQALLTGLNENGLNILGADVMQQVISRHRIRYLGGLDESKLAAFRDEAGAAGVLITELELYSDAVPPKIALTSRLVSTDQRTRILWIDGIGLAGDDSPGLLDLGLIEDSRQLLEIAVQNLTDSLSNYIAGRSAGMGGQRASGKFRPKVAYRSPILNPNNQHTLAVVPFLNLSERKFAGEIMALHFVKELHDRENLFVVDPGIIRQTMLDMRIIMSDGVSRADTDLVFSRLNVDLILSGRILDYQDYQGPAGTPKVDFVARITERKSREVVWTVKSYNQGDDGVFFFDWGRVNTAYAMADQMVQLAVEEIGE